MKRPGTPLFLQRRPYRRRRRIDAARLLPVFGGFLFLLPMLWEPAEAAGRRTAQDGVYLFVIWVGMILVAWLLAPGLAEPEGPDPREE
jgi:hypothetical protein